MRASSFHQKSSINTSFPQCLPWTGHRWAPRKLLAQFRLPCPIQGPACLWPRLATLEFPALCRELECNPIRCQLASPDHPPPVLLAWGRARQRAWWTARHSANNLRPWKLAFLAINKFIGMLPFVLFVKPRVALATLKSPRERWTNDRPQSLQRSLFPCAGGGLNTFSNSIALHIAVLYT